MNKLLSTTMLLAIMIAVLIFTACVNNPNSRSKTMTTDNILLTEKDDANSQYQLGYKYYLGNDVPQDFGKAVELFQKAANQEKQPIKAMSGHNVILVFVIMKDMEDMKIAKT